MIELQRTYCNAYVIAISTHWVLNW